MARAGAEGFLFFKSLLYNHIKAKHRKAKSAVLPLLFGLALGGCSRGISGVNSSDPYVAEQAREAQDLQTQYDAQQKTVATEKDRLKSLKLQLDGAKQNLKGRKLATNP